MSHYRTVLGLCGLLLATVAWGCSSAGDDDDQPAAALFATDFQVASSNFTEIRPKVRIPNKNTCHGENLSPPLSWSGAPQGTISFALIAEDTDHVAGEWAHWVLYDIPAQVTGLPEGIPTSTSVLPDGTKQGRNDSKNTGYGGPCPTVHVIQWHPVDGDKRLDSAHKYKFSLYALDAQLGLAPGATKEELIGAIEGHILAQADTVGKFQVAPITAQKQAVGRSINESFRQGATSTGP